MTYANQNRIDSALGFRLKLNNQEFFAAYLLILSLLMLNFKKKSKIFKEEQFQEIKASCLI